MSETGRCLGTFQDAVFDYFLSVQVDNYLLLLRLKMPSLFAHLCRPGQPCTKQCCLILSGIRY
jgi:hypothetical protein